MMTRAVRHPASAAVLVLLAGPATGGEKQPWWEGREREAVLAAFNEDDGWFPTRMLGFRLWAGLGLGRAMVLEAAYFRERRDDLEDHVERPFLDLTWFRR